MSRAATIDCFHFKLFHDYSFSLKNVKREKIGYSFKFPKVTSSNCFFCPTKSEDSSFALRNDKEKAANPHVSDTAAGKVLTFLLLEK